MIYFTLFCEFFKIGLFALGGGMVTIPFLAELPSRYDWFTSAQLVDFIAISESTPGPIGVNMATYAGYHAAGVLGGIVATLSLVLPSLIIVLLVAKFLASFSENKIVRGVFYGIRPAVTALIASALLGILKVVLLVENGGGFSVNLSHLLLFLAAFGLMQLKPLKKLHPAIWILGAAAVGIAAKL